MVALVTRTTLVTCDNEAERATRGTINCAIQGGLPSFTTHVTQQHNHTTLVFIFGCDESDFGTENPFEEPAKLHKQELFFVGN